MDYKRIYDAFIAAACEREPDLIASGRYKERHHIEPVFKDGWHYPENLIYLTGREHMFAHAVLALSEKGKYQERPMMNSAVAVFNLTKTRTRRGAVNEVIRRKYSWIPKRWAITNCGPNHTGYKHDVFTLYHEDGRHYSGTRQELITLTGLPFRQVYDLAGGRRPKYNGWFAKKIDRDAHVEQIAIARTLGKIRPSEVNLYHPDGRMITGAPRDLYKQLGVDRNLLYAIQAGRIKSVAGWHISPTAAAAEAERLREAA